MHRLLAKAILYAVVVAAPLSAQMQFHGIPPSVTSPTPAFSGCCPGFFGGTATFGHNPRFNVFFGTPFFPARHIFFRRRFFVPVPVVVPYYPAPYYPAPYYPYSADVQPVQQTYDNSVQRELVSEVANLRDEVARLREQNEQRSQTRPLQPPERKPAAAPGPEAPPTILVFRNGRVLEARNYAIVGQTLWIMTEQRAKKIPLSELDLEATVRRNEDIGLEFRLPPTPKH